MTKSNVEYYYAVGRNGKDDYIFLAWKDGEDKFCYICPDEDNYPYTREHQFVASLVQQDLNTAMNKEIPNRAPFKLRRRQLTPGSYYPRIRRGELIRNEVVYGMPSLSLDEMGLRCAVESSMSSARILFKRMQNIFEVVEPVQSQEKTYGNEFRHLLILACTEVESAWRSILLANGYKGDRSRWNTRAYVKLLSPMGLSDWQVRLLRSHETLMLMPFST